MWDAVFSTLMASIELNVPFAWVNTHTCGSPVVSSKQRLTIAAIHVWNLYFARVVVMVIPVYVLI